MGEFKIVETSAGISGADIPQDLEHRGSTESLFLSFDLTTSEITSEGFKFFLVE